MPPEIKQPTREEFIKSLFILEEKDNVFSEKETKKSLVKGIKKGVDAIKVSYGSEGSNAIIQHDLYPFHIVTNDGKTILKDIKLADPMENMGLDVLKEVAEKSDKESGDGRKSSIVLTGAILEEGMKIDASPMAIKRSLNECLPLIIKSLEDQTKKIGVKDVGAIAEIAGENKELAKIFQSIYKEIGKEGIVELDNSGIPDTFYEITEGVKLHNAGFTYPYMANEDKGRKAVYKNPYVLVSKQKISNISQLDRIMEAVYKQGRSELVIFCDEIDLAVSQSLAALHIEGVVRNGGHLQFRTLVIKAPTLWKDWMFEDFAKITGAKIVDPAQGITLKNFQLAYLGICDKIIVSKDETIVLGGKDITDHLKVLEEMNTDEAKIRIARLQTKTAILKLGANSETELFYIRGKALDARNASYLALNGGVVPGGGVALYIASLGLPDTVGGNILKHALKYPLYQICENLEMEIGEDFVPSVDTFGEHIKDPATVVKNAITNALSVASTVLTIKLGVVKSK